MKDFFAFHTLHRRQISEGTGLRDLRQGPTSRRAAVIGSNTDEGSFLIPEKRPTAAEFESQLDSAFGANRGQVRQLYPTDSPEALIRSELNLAADLPFNYPMWKWALLHRQAERPVYYYLFGRVVPVPDGQRFKGIPRTAIGAFHGDEVPYVFGTLDKAALSLDGSSRKSRWENTDRELSAAMLNYWANLSEPAIPMGMVCRHGHAMSQRHTIHSCVSTNGREHCRTSERHAWKHSTERSNTSLK